ncbi:hypothetical protein ACFOY2_11095 [Nonomuraea purpurea]|uniref:DUF1311 domain-containing protein n=1 Tax=Nonomuraea purpurea TaxID=1849276 RepID=A0ABV8G1B1_9ACTN
MPHGDDLDAQFNELVSQIGTEEQRRMRAAARKGARQQQAEWALAGPRRRVGRGWLAMAGITVVIVAAGVVVTFRPDLLTPSSPAIKDAAPMAESPLPAQTRLAVASPRPVAGPFDGSPAAEYAQGRDGISIPQAKALGELSKKDVAAGLERARDLLAAAYLDRQTLMGGEPDAFAEALSAEQRSWFREGERNTRPWVLSFAPKTVELATDVIKVKGSSKLSAYREDGISGAKLETNHLIVYAIQRPGRPDTLVRFVKHHRGTVLIYRDEQGLVTWIRDWNSDSTPVDCEAKEDGYEHPAFPGSDPGGERPVTGEIADPYDLNEPQLKGECASAKRT